MLKVFKCSEKAVVPSYSTHSSACFDIHACIEVENPIKVFGVDNQEDKVSATDDSSFTLFGFQRALVPTRLKFHIPPGYSLRIHPRSGLALKNGIALANCEGVVDEDYVHEVFVAVHNVSNQPFVIKHGDRIAQAELVKDERTSISVSDEEPTTKTNRVGGFGSTGV